MTYEELANALVKSLNLRETDGNVRWTLGKWYDGNSLTRAVIEKHCFKGGAYCWTDASLKPKDFNEGCKYMLEKYMEKHHNVTFGSESELHILMGLFGYV